MTLFEFIDYAADLPLDAVELTSYYWAETTDAYAEKLRQHAEKKKLAISGVPVLDRRYILESLTGLTPLGGLTPNEFGALLPSRQYLVIRRGIELLFTLLLLPLLFGAKDLYQWVTLLEKGDKIIVDKSWYLNLPFLYGRWAIYAVFLSGMVYLLRKKEKQWKI